MIYINPEKTANSRLNEILGKIYLGKSIPKLIEISELGSIVKSSLSLKNSVKSIITLDNNQEFINSPYLVYKLENDFSFQDIDLDSEIPKNNIKEVSIINSHLKTIKLNQNIVWAKEIDLIVDISNSEIDFLFLTTKHKYQGSIHSLHISIQNLQCKILSIKNETNTKVFLDGFKTKILHLKVSEIEIVNSKFEIPIFQDLASLDLTLRNSTLEFPKFLPSFTDFEDSYKKEFENLLPIHISEIAASLKFLKNSNDSAIFSTSIDRLFSYFDSRKGIINKILYFYTNYYYNLFYPSLGFIFSIILFQTILQTNSGFYKDIGLENSLFPYDLLKTLVLKDFHITRNLHDISFSKVLLFVLACFNYFSIFSISLAIKRRFGYSKIQ